MATRRALLGTLAGTLALAARPAGAQMAIPYVPPVSRPKALTLLVGGPAGSGTDLWVRGFAPFLERHLKQVQVTIANRVGGGGLTAMRDLAEARPDGTVLAYAATPFHIVRAVERDAAPLLDRIAFLGAVTEEPVALLATPGTELDQLRIRGGTRPLGLPPPVSAASVAAAELAQLLPMEQLHFPSAAAARQAAASGNVAAALLAISEAAGAVREGKLALLGIAAPARHPQWPETPTLRELGMPVEGALRRGIAAPAGIAPAASAAVIRALRAAVTDPEFLAQAEARGILPVFRDAEAWTALVHHDRAELRHRWETSPWPVSGG
ncbi:Tripartite-type tricarboxylate transporter, receptor component TctC [Roseomonas rosea]|uniref:Tripartite-type tricarboxylate transporter, receptor component TctC n=1 Tax=Muricoccus roseus TaxID=198092 RepID=A0A1M6Q638_9PROT|nr:tripartite tricarboxylate transporter substrate-binding protein [Roseomonas rosea]SHK15566.1 Tripartite-type tricarboxylate transporter, receptor component TctC [Roseomonas rosea]